MTLTNRVPDDMLQGKVAGKISRTCLDHNTHTTLSGWMCRRIH
jgi:hypothetical protein